MWYVLALALLGAVIVWLRRRVRFAQKPGCGPYFIEAGCLVLNYRIPQHFPLENIARVEFSAWEGDGLRVYVLLKDGRGSSFQFREAPPGLGARWQADLERAGVRCLWM